ncbi:MAG TPA: peptidase [Sphingomonas sp.]|jgi:putative proteasome-type protease|uniref:peptidase n=1 Tax=Sphingomonas sp. TaxID=28214 RepID=UPI002ED823F9
MTYCIGINVRDGLIMMSDTRTNAGIDNISSYRKMHLLADGPDRLIMCLSAGNLSMTQHVLGQLAEGLEAKEPDARRRIIADQPSMFRVTQLVGEAVMKADAEIGAGLRAADISGGVSLLVGGRIGGGPIRLFLVYSAGNFIECLPESPFLQIGERKYGKPILDRTMNYDTELEEAVKVGLLSFDSTIRSNLSVGLPIDVLVIPANAARPVIRRRIEVDDPYFQNLSVRWSMMLNEARATIPDPPFMRVG